MIFYYLIAFTFFIFGLFTVKPFNGKYRTLFVYLIFLILVVIIGFRWKMATDWEPYFNNFDNYSFDNDNFEIGYKIVTFLIHSFTSDYSIFLLLYTFVYLFIFYLALSKIKLLNIFTLLLYFSLTLGLWGSHRQLMSISISFYSLYFLFNNRNLNFLLLIFAASLFHYSALFCLFFYIIKIDIPKPFYLIIILALTLFGTLISDFLLNNIFSKNELLSFDKFLIYLDGASNVEIKPSFIGLVKRIVLFIFFYYFSFKISNKSYFHYFLKIYFFGIIVYFIFKDTMPILINRGSLYFNLMEIFMIPIILYECKDAIKYFLFSFIIFIYSLVMINQSIINYKDLFVPYQSKFFNYSYTRFLY